ncbi:hypothetical protein ACFP3Q_11090 [Nocardioides sp. GCM10027113]|uniref:hypothetical protein n=1 Tax=unclassified Nocardioides TaxID=2615069 RepID=UPI0036226515
MLQPARTRRALTGAALAATLVLGACSGGGDEPEAAGPADASPSAGETYLPVPEEVELTAQGSELEVGDTATVAWRPDQQTVGALDVKVTRMERASFKMFVGWQITDAIRETTPFFVHAEVTNVGETDLGGRRVPLYGVDGDNRLLEASTFASSFKACAGETLPGKFRAGASTKACLVYLAPDNGDLVAASFRPTEDFVPITWTGEVTKAAGDSAKKKSGSAKAAGKSDKKPGKKSDGKQG